MLYLQNKSSSSRWSRADGADVTECGWCGRRCAGQSVSYMLLLKAKTDRLGQCSDDSQTATQLFWFIIGDKTVLLLPSFMKQSLHPRAAANRRMKWGGCGCSLQRLIFLAGSGQEHRSFRRGRSSCWRKNNELITGRLTVNALLAFLF